MKVSANLFAAVTKREVRVFHPLYDYLNLWSTPLGRDNIDRERVSNYVARKPFRLSPLRSLHAIRAGVVITTRYKGAEVTTQTRVDAGLGTTRCSVSGSGIVRFLFQTRTSRRTCSV